MEITEAKIIAFLKDVEGSYNVRFITNAILDPLNWSVDGVNRLIPKVRKVLNMMASKGSIDKIQRGRGYCYRYVSPTAHAAQVAWAAQREKDHATATDMLRSAGMSEDDIANIVSYRVMHMSFDQFFRFVNGIRKS